MTESTLRWGIIGCGAVTEVKSGPALMNVPRSTVTAVMRRDGQKAQDYAARHGVAKWYDTSDALLKDPDVNAIYIATPPATHAALAEAALQSGRPVLLEKPIAMTSAECDAIIEKVDATGLPLAVAHYRRRLPRFERLRRLVQDGAIGDPRLVTVTEMRDRQADGVRRWANPPAGGSFFDGQSHTLDWLDFVLGPASGIVGTAASMTGASGLADVVTFNGRFGEVPVAAACAYCVATRADLVTVHGSAGSVAMPFLSWGPLRLTQASGEQSFDIEDPPHVHQPFIEAFVNHILDGAPNPCSARDARRTILALEQIMGRSAA